MWCSMLLPKDFDKKRTFSITSVSIGWSINAKFCIQFILTPGRSSSECGPSQTKRFVPSPSSLFPKILDQTSLLSKSSTRPAKRESQTSFILYLLSNIFSQYEQHIDLQREKLRLLKTEFEGIKDDLDKHGDKYVDKYIGPERSCTVCFISSGPKRRSRYKLPRQVCFISISPQSVVDHISGRGRILQTILSSFWVIRKPWLFWTRWVFETTYLLGDV